MSCLILLMEDQIELLRKQVKDAALSHDAQHAKIIALEAEIAELRAKGEPQTLMMTAAEPSANASVE
jgi:phage shock protein A